MPNDSARVGRAVTWLPAGIPLRVRLVAVACCLVAAGAAVIGLACDLAARDGLMWQADQELRAYEGFLVSRPFTAMPVGPGPGGAASSAFVIEVTSGGRLVMRTGTDLRPGPAVAGIPYRAGQLATVPASSGGGSWLVVTEPVRYSTQRILFTYGSDGYYLDITSTARPGTDGTLVVGLDLSSTGQAVRKITVGFAVISCAAVLGVALLGLVVTRAVLRPLARIEQTAAGISAHGLSRQVSGADPPDDTGGLVRSLADTCRQLRQPVSVIRGFTEYYRERGPLTGRELDRMMARVADEAARMDALIDGLASGRHDQAPPPGNRRPTIRD